MNRVFLTSFKILFLLSTTSVLIIYPANASGTTYISQTYGGSNEDSALSVVQTVDGGYVLAGTTYSFGVKGTHVWLVKTDASGNHVWNQTYGGTKNYVEDGGWSVIQTVDEGYAIAGYTVTFGTIKRDFWLVKTDASGNHIWNQTYGGTDNDYGHSLVQTVDGGYAITGYTRSLGAGSSDFWLVKTDELGNHVWNQTYGGTEGDIGWSVIQTSDGGYAITGYTGSFGVGQGDFWLVKTDQYGVIPEFPAWTPLLLVTVFTAAIIIYRRKLLKKQSTGMRMR